MLYDLDLCKTNNEPTQLHRAMREFGAEQTWLRWTDEGSEGAWRDRWTGEQQDFLSIPWRLASEPTGFTVENCTGVKNEDESYYWAFDIDCSQLLAVTCQHVQEYFRLRGLCSGSSIDRLYRLIQPTHNGRRRFLGPSGLVLTQN